MSIFEIALLAVVVVGPAALGIFLSLLLAECAEARGMVKDERQVHYGGESE